MLNLKYLFVIHLKIQIDIFLPSKERFLSKYPGDEP